MFSPGSKGWIAKYFQLVKSEQIMLSWQQPHELPTEQFNHHFLAQSGIVFGYPSKLLFGKELDQTKWTKNEKLTQFYKHHKIKSLSSLIGYIFKESKEEKLERILAKRTEVPKNIIHTK